jgi:hypothetical protein
VVGAVRKKVTQIVECPRERGELLEAEGGDCGGENRTADGSGDELLMVVD